MAININNYVSITSGVGAGTSVAQRQLIARIFTTSALVPTGGVAVEFTSAADVGAYFGFASEEYARALFYFSFISKNITTPTLISFSHWASADSAPLIYGNVQTPLLATFTAITSGEFTLQMGAFSHSFTGIDLSGAGSLTAVAADIQTAIRAYSAGGSLFTGATVTWDSVRGSFDLVGGATGAATISVTAGVSNDLAAPLGWLAGAIFSNGVVAESITTTLTQSAGISNNFGSFCFTTAAALDLAQVTEAATWNAAQNVYFQYQVPVSASNAASWSAALINIAGVGLTLSITSGEYPEMAPMMILAATDYTARNAVQNYMFYQFTLTPSVTTDADYNTYTALRINFYGQTQTAGQQIAFYQEGFLMGEATDPIDMNVYGNEQWFKDAAEAAIMTLLLALSEVPANVAGQNLLLTTLQSVIQQAKFNGTISPGKTLSNAQILYINGITGSSTAWQQVQNSGYWLNVVIESYVQNSITKYKAVYTLVYSKNDVIRKVEGSDILI